MRGSTEVGRRLLVVLPDRDEAAAHDHDDVRDRECHLTDDLRIRAEVDAGQHLEEEQQQRDAHHDLGGDEREQHERVDAAPAGPAPPLQPECESDADRRRHEDAHDAEEQRVLERTLKGRVVEDAPVRRREPARGEALPRRPRTAVVEREQHGDRNRDERPEDVRAGDDEEKSRLAPRVAQPGHQWLLRGILSWCSGENRAGRGRRELSETAWYEHLSWYQHPFLSYLGDRGRSPAMCLQPRAAWQDIPGKPLVVTPIVRAPRRSQVVDHQPEQEDGEDERQARALDLLRPLAGEQVDLVPEHARLRRLRDEILRCSSPRTSAARSTRARRGSRGATSAR